MDIADDVSIAVEIDDPLCFQTLIGGLLQTALFQVVQVPPIKFRAADLACIGAKAVGGQGNSGGWVINEPLGRNFGQYLIHGHIPDGGIGVLPLANQLGGRNELRRRRHIGQHTRKAQCQQDGKNDGKAFHRLTSSSARAQPWSCK